jgi:hypothetical protein
MSVIQAIAPVFGSNQIVTANSSSQSTPINASAPQVRVVNTGANKAYVRTYSSSGPAQSATTADFVVLPNMASTFTKSNHDTLAYISASGTTLEIISGDGL